MTEKRERKEKGVLRKREGLRIGREGRGEVEGGQNRECCLNARSESLIKYEHTLTT